ncbi:CRISPR-associated helicase Cas3' [Heliobacterium undosum]|uniref:CRISPR-associated helicase Cas3 n=1 Tax=Heliomicrobium undosum TaxID=121734 RepID=A0A845LAT6_9FIRM|nr:CRISPR-associated helicase Cas3' [Heliomicrobium undosum]MZP30798.1 CRISPR-associated helicase Cas3' [Heliomicrobium undosum]
MKYYAHSLPDQPEEQWQLLHTHLLQTAERAAQFADRFNAAPWGEAAGLLHDIGKYAREFQKRLRGSHISVDHSTAGAQLATRLYPNGQARILAYTSAGHHTGLPDSGFHSAGSQNVKGTLFNRLETPDLHDYSAYMTEITPVPGQRLERLPIGPIKKQQGVSVSLFVRMLFSCLVDADYLDTERFMQPELAALRDPGEDLSALLDKLEKHLEEKCQKAAKTVVNQARADILRQCREKAELAPGLFTLTVPTGGGKTLSAMDFALRHAVKNGLDRVICVIPFTSIIEQNAALYREIFGDDNVLEHHSTYQPERHHPVDAYEDDMADNRALRWKLATENWDKPIVVTTNVQFFESLYANRSSRCRKLHNLARSVIILDEAQMIPDRFLKPCLAALTELVRNYGATMLLCTATQPALNGLLPTEVTSREIIDQPQTLYEQLRRVTVRNAGRLNDEQLIEQLAPHSQALCIVNTRRHARILFEYLGESARMSEGIGVGEGCWHLSALMCPKHRTLKLKEIREALRRGNPCKVISTPLIEAGVDVDFPIVYRAFAGLDSIAQAAGRCNREGKRKNGEVLVFSPDKESPKGWPALMAKLGERAWREGDDPLSLEAIKRFFTYRFEIEAEKLDEQGIIKQLQEGVKPLAFPFKDIAERFRIIDSEQVSVVIPFDDEACSLIDEVAQGRITAAIRRRLQAYTVGVYRFDWLNYCRAGAVKTEGGLIQVLVDKSYYDDNIGLLPCDGRGASTDLLLISD